MEWEMKMKAEEKLKDELQLKLIWEVEMNKNYQIL